MSQEFFNIKIVTKYIPKLVLISPIQYHVQLSVPNKYTVFCKAGTVAPRSLNLNFPWSYSSAATAKFKLMIVKGYIHRHMFLK